MSIVDLQNSVNQKLPDNQVMAITPTKLREAVFLIINYLGSVADQVSQATSVMAKQGDVQTMASSLQSLGSNLSALASSLGNLSNALSDLNAFVRETPQAAIAPLSENPPSLLNLVSLGNGLSDTNKTVNKIVSVLKAKKLIA